MNNTSVNSRIAPHTNENLPFYAYEKIPTPRCFRLFHLEHPEQPVQGLPERGDMGAFLSGHITIQSLDHCVDYDALSYCWTGSIESTSVIAQDKDCILIKLPNGSMTRLLIGAPLSIALRHLRSRGQPRPIFIDQICIDQAENVESLREKNQQIALMGDIYRCCTRVVGWLDVATAQSDMFFDYIPLIAESDCLRNLAEDEERRLSVLRALISKQTDSEDASLQHDVETILNLAERYWSQFPHLGLLDICMRKWFRRIWIVQEACLGPEMVMVCGQRSCSVRDLEMATTFQRLAASQDKPSYRSSILSLLWPDKTRNGRHQAFAASTIVDRLLFQRARIRRPQPGQSHRQKLAAIISRFNVDSFAQGSWGRLGASDPRDYIFAMRGLAQPDDPLLTDMEPDYTKSATDIYIDFAHQTFDPAIDYLLLSRPSSKNLKHLPSWVPDWSADLVLPHGYKLASIPIFSAGETSGHSQLAELDLSTRGILKAKGFELCKVDRIGTCSMEFRPQAQAPHPGESMTILSKTIFNFYREVKQLGKWAATQSSPASLSSSTSLDRAVWVTATGGHGLSFTTEGSVLGRDINGTPLLGRLWELQMDMDVFPTIQKRRRDGLMRIQESWSARMKTPEPGHFGLFHQLKSLLTYCAGRVKVEALHFLWCYKYFVTRPFINKDSRDLLYYSVFGAKFNPDLAQLLTTLQRHVGRKGFASEQGHFGLVSSGKPVGDNGDQDPVAGDTAVGDLVVVLLGASTPIVLRPAASVPGRYSYVGEAYCHGFMHGEAMEKGREKAKWFEIC